jgi:DNA-binding response OmpR family regulator
MTTASTATKRILVVDDDPVLRMLLTMGLKKAGYDVLTANHGGEAVGVLGNQQVDLILLDLMMPIMDGLRLLEWLKNNSATKVLALVFSSFEGKTMAERAIDAGAADYMSKPVQLDRLLDRVNRLLNR